MKKILFILFISYILFSAFLVNKKNKIIFFGDSITELGVKEKGFVSLIKNNTAFSNWDIIGKGQSGNKIYDLFLRLEEDVLESNPQKVVIYIGVNDVWHKYLSGTGTDYDKFIKFYQAIIDRLKEAGTEIILVTPAVVGELKGNKNELDSELDKYAAAIRALAKENQLKICDLRNIFVTYIKDNNFKDEAKNLLTYDGVHLNDKGNQLVADHLLPLLK